MGTQGGSAPGGAGPGGRARSVAAVSVLVVALAACGGGGGGGNAAAPSAADRAAAEKLLGPKHPAAGAPVRIGLVSDGESPAFDARTEIYAAKATADWWNARRGGIA